MAERFDKDYIRLLAHKWKRGKLTDAERDDLAHWEASHTDDMLELPDDSGGPKAVKARMYQRIVQATGTTMQERRIRRWLPYAAAILLVASVVGYFAVDSHKSSVLPTGQAGDRLAATEILPGGNRATLTLADGRTIDLSSEQEGIIIQDGITYLDGSQVMENEELRMKNDRPLNLNSITTPKGGTYQITLPDGSKVWLNSASTLKYPSRFSGDSRRVILEGEAYFEIKKQRIKEQGRNVETHDYASFNVLTAGQVVEVLGTQFNISAYADDEETKTTLVEGRVRVSGLVEPVPTGREAQYLAPNKASGTQKGLTTHDSGLTTKILQPGDQSIVRARLPGQGASIETHRIEVDQYTAWKDGMFAFNDEPLESIMRKVARWYDVEVRYEAGVNKQETYGGNFSRFDHVSSVLRKLELTGGIHFKIEGRTIIISNE